MQRINVEGFEIEPCLWYQRHGFMVPMQVQSDTNGYRASAQGVQVLIKPAEAGNNLCFDLICESNFPTRLRVGLRLHNQTELFHLIPANIHGDNNARHVRAGEFPCLSDQFPGRLECSPIWEFRAERAPVPASFLCCTQGAIGIEIEPRSDGIINGVFASLPNVAGVSMGYCNDPLTFNEKTMFLPSTQSLHQGGRTRIRIHAARGEGRQAVHRIVRDIYHRRQERPVFKQSYRTAARALAEAFANVNFDEQVGQYTNRSCVSPGAPFKPWRAIVEIGWTGGSVLAYPLMLAQAEFGDLKLPMTGQTLFDQIASGFNPTSGFIFDTILNRYVKHRPAGWNESEINGWWSGFIPQTKDAHCAYNQAHAAYYLLLADERAGNPQWQKVALDVLETAMQLQHEDGRFGYIFDSSTRRVIDYEGFAGCWFVPALVHAYRQTRAQRHLDAAIRAMHAYGPSVRDLVACGTPMDTFKSIDSEGNLAYIRAARLLHETTGDDLWLERLREGAEFEYLWRYAYRTIPEAEPLLSAGWNSCGGSVTSVSNPHIHPMSVLVTDDLEYLAARTGDAYHASRAEDGLAWLMQTLELYPEVTGYGCYGVLSERTCPSDGLLSEKHADGSPVSTWWSYNAWAAANALEALMRRILNENQTV